MAKTDSVRVVRATFWSCVRVPDFDVRVNDMGVRAKQVVVRFLDFTVRVRVRAKMAVSVEKVWKSLRESVWSGCAKKCGKRQKSGFCTWRSAFLEVFHSGCGKFYHEISTGFYLCYWWVLHNFHSPYYDYYYYI